MFDFGQTVTLDTIMEAGICLIVAMKTLKVAEVSITFLRETSYRFTHVDRLLLALFEIVIKIKKL